jgi:hypothetical protein
MKRNTFSVAKSLATSNKLNDINRLDLTVFAGHAIHAHGNHAAGVRDMTDKEAFTVRTLMCLLTAREDGDERDVNTAIDALAREFALEHYPPRD